MDKSKKSVGTKYSASIEIESEITKSNQNVGLAVGGSFVIPILIIRTLLG